MSAQASDRPSVQGAGFCGSPPPVQQPHRGSRPGAHLTPTEVSFQMLRHGIRYTDQLLPEVFTLKAKNKVSEYTGDPLKRVCTICGRMPIRGTSRAYEVLVTKHVDNILFQWKD